MHRSFCTEFFRIRTVRASGSVLRPEIADPDSISAVGDERGGREQEGRLLTLPFQKISVALQLLSNAQPSFPNTRLCTFRKFAVPRCELAQLVRVESAGLILGHRVLLACLRRLKGDLENEARAMIVLISA